MYKIIQNNENQLQKKRELIYKFFIKNNHINKNRRFKNNKTLI